MSVNLPYIELHPFSNLELTKYPLPSIMKRAGQATRLCGSFFIDLPPYP